MPFRERSLNPSTPGYAGPQELRSPGERTRPPFNNYPWLSGITVTLVVDAAIRLSVLTCTLFVFLCSDYLHEQLAA